MGRYYDEVARVAVANESFETAGRMRGAAFDALCDVVEDVERSIESQALRPADDDDAVAEAWLDRNRTTLRPNNGGDGRVVAHPIDRFPLRER